MSKLEFRGISMEFPGVRALDAVSFSVEAGKITALMGENGAGKSTLLKILYGDYQPTAGEVLFEDKPLDFASPNEALDAGVSIIYQERQIFGDMSVAENLFVGRQPRGALGLIDYKSLYAKTQEVIDEFGLDIRPTDRVSNLSTANQQMVEIMKACSRELRVIAFDEPTASLDEDDTRRLFAIIRKLAARGILVLYVSHRMSEIFQLCQEVVVFKDGCVVGQRAIEALDEQTLIRMMIGRDLGEIYSALDRNEAIGDTVLELRGLCSPAVSDISFSLRRGEILGFSGLVGAGRTEVMRAIIGADPVSGGELLLEGRPVAIRNPTAALRHGISYCSEDRKTEGIIPTQTLRSNISMAVWDRLCRLRWFVHGGRERELAAGSIERFHVKAAGMEQKILFLSGGNQQKAIVARFVATDPKILILDEPTKGIDVGAKAEMYSLICELTRQGIGVLFISSDLTEIIGLCDRVIVMREGRITGRLERGELSEDKLLACAVLEQ